MSSDVRLEWIDTPTVKKALRLWYSRPEAPNGAINSLGVFESGRFAGVIVFGKGATNTLVKRYGYEQHQGCELVRVAFAPDHRFPVSKALGIGLRLLKKQAPGLHLVVTFADTTQHHGGIYQATGWIYTGTTKSAVEYVIDGRQFHGRSFRAMPKEQQDRATKVLGTAKHRYLYPLSEEARDRVRPLALPYPKSACVPTDPLGTT